MNNNIIIKKLSKHLAESGLTYTQHLARALKIFVMLSKATVLILIHGFLPFTFETSATDTIKEIYSKYIE